MDQSKFKNMPNESKNTAHRNTWYTITAVLKEKCITINADIRNEGRFCLNNLNLYLRKLEKEQNETKAIRSK